MMKTAIDKETGLPYIVTVREKIEQETLKQLKYKTVMKVRYLTDQEVINFGWSKSPLVIIFDDGSYIFAQSDDEGNNSGCITGYCNTEKTEIYCPTAYPITRDKS